MQTIERDRPCLRPVEAIPDPLNRRIILRDPTQLAAGMLVVGQAELLLLTLFNGEHSWLEIQAEFARRSGRLLLSHELEELLGELDAAGYLAGPGFETYYDRLREEYRRMPIRPLREPDGFGMPSDELSGYLDQTLAEADTSGEPSAAGLLCGIVAPHLDYPRGRPCYGAGYRCLQRALGEGETPRRVVVLGTNHFGRSSSVVGTTKDFQTPWGVVRVDGPFLQKLRATCGGDLLPYELDHLREHSVDLQVAWLHHLLGDGFRIVPFLCPDPSGPRGTAPGDPGGVDLREFALALAHLLRDDPDPTLLVASADLSHVGGYFGDRLALESGFLSAVRQADEAALRFVDGGDAEALRLHMAQTGNPTRWCSVGCLYALMTALGPGAQAHRLRYHQAAVAELENCVTSAAFAFTR
jgi:AmmeMemoRadiSam system protein B